MTRLGKVLQSFKGVTRRKDDRSKYAPQEDMRVQENTCTLEMDETMEDRNGNNIPRDEKGGKDK